MAGTEVCGRDLEPGALEGCRPPAVRFLHAVSRWTRLPVFACVLLVCLLPYVVGLLFAWPVEGGIERHTAFWLRVNIFMVTAAAFILIDFIYRRILTAVSDVLSPLQDEAEADRVRAALRFTFTARQQWWFYVLFGAPVIASILALLGLPFEGALWGFYLVYAVLSILLVMTGLWISIGLIYLAAVYSRCDSIRLNLVEPLNTPGVRPMANLSTTWGLCFTVAAVLVLVGLWLAPWSGSPRTVFLTTVGWTLFVVACTAVTIVYPKMLLRALLDRGKRRRLEWFQTTMAECEDRCFDMPLEEIQRRERALGLLKEYNDLYSRIARARTSAFDVQTVLKLVGSMLVPILMLAMRNRAALSKLVETIKGP